MSLEQAIHEKWEAVGSLTALVPSERVVTGLLKTAPELPYITLERAPAGACTRMSSGGRVEPILFTFHIWDGELDRAKEIALQIHAEFAQADFIWSAGRVLDIRPAGQRETPAEHGVWHLACEFLVQLLFT